MPQRRLVRHLYFMLGHPVLIIGECYRRQQAQSTTPRVPDWIRLYEVLVELEKDIEVALPEFQELVMGLQYVSYLPTRGATLLMCQFDY